MGLFLETFFEERMGSLEPNHDHEVTVLCPFVHDKGYEARPSAHVNVEKKIFHCKTCFAEGRLGETGGLSEIGFVAKYYGLSYRDAIKMLQTFDGKTVTEENWGTAVENLSTNDDLMEYLTEKRGLTKETIREYQLGYTGGGIDYPVFMNGVLLDKRTYNPNPGPDEPKIKSEKGSSALLFPYDAWKDDPRPTLFCAGENDTLLARQNGFNALTSTFGEGSFPQLFAKMFAGKEVYICYDCDEAGQKGARKVAYYLHEAGAQVRIVDLGLAGTKEDKDISDFFLKHNRSADDLFALMENSVPFTGEMFLEQKNEKYPLVNLWEVPHGKWSGRKISSRVIMMGKFDVPMEVPTAVEWTCAKCLTDAEGQPEGVCKSCPIRLKSGWWTIEDKNLDDVLELVEVKLREQEQTIKMKIGCPKECPGGFRSWSREKQHVQKVIFSPDAETEDEQSGYRATEHYAYTLGLDLEDGMRYRAFFRRFPHPKNTQIVSVVDRVEDSDNAVNTFKMTPEVMQQLSQFQGNPYDVMAHRFQIAKEVAGNFVNQMVVEATNIMYHSVLDFRYAGVSEKGHPEGLIVGESRSGKTSPIKRLQQFYGIGNMTDLKASSTAGLLGGADKTPSGSHRIRWGKIPRNHKGMIVLDEMSGMPSGVMSSLTAVRSERVARLEKIVSGAAPAKTRLLWVSNPKVGSDGNSKPIALYPHGVKLVLDLVGSDEDVARFDFIYIMKPGQHYISPFSEDETPEYKTDSEPYRNLIRWVWSRTIDQVKFAPGVEQYIWQIAQELNEKYDTSVKLFGAEAHKKLARIAVSVAGICFSHDGRGDCILVNKSHVDWSRDFLISCYDNEVFRLADYVEQQKSVTTLTEEIEIVFANLVNSQPMLMRTISKQSEISLFQLQTMTGLDKDNFSSCISNLVRHGLIESGNGTVMPTLRFRKARDAYVKHINESKLTPLSQKGSLMI